MGGNAMKEYGARRVSLDEYTELSAKLLEVLPFEVVTIPYIRDKKDFGDLDVLACGDGNEDIQQTLNDSLRLHGTPFKSNGNVVSFLFQHILQVDVIFQPEDELEFARRYYSWGDLGNLIGRVAKSLGWKFGNDGLWLRMEDASPLLLTRDFDQALDLLGYDSEKFAQGFDTSASAFEYVASSRYFSPRVYQWSHRSHKDKTRDSKRPGYRAFLEWLEGHCDLSREPQQINRNVLEYTFDLFPEAKAEHERRNEARRRALEAGKKFPTYRIITLTELSGWSLGHFLEYLREFTGMPRADWILSKDVEQLEIDVMAAFYRWSEDDHSSSLERRYTGE